MANEHNLIPVKKGEVRNPKGRGKGVPNSKTVLKKLLSLTEKIENPVTGELEDMSQLEIMFLRQLSKARQGDLSAMKEILDRYEGKAQQNIDMSVQATDPRKEILDKYLGDGNDVGQTPEA